MNSTLIDNMRFDRSTINIPSKTNGQQSSSPCARPQSFPLSARMMQDRHERAFFPDSAHSRTASSPDYNNLSNIVQHLTPEVIRHFLGEPPKSSQRNPELYKTTLCDYWSAGTPCRFGTRCWYAHGPDELRIAQFVVPATPTRGSDFFDYQIRRSLFKNNSKDHDDQAPHSCFLSKMVGCEHAAIEKFARICEHLSNPPLPFDNFVDSGLQSDLRSSVTSESSAVESGSSSSLSDGSRRSSVSQSPGHSTEDNACKTSDKGFTESGLRGLWADTPVGNDDCEVTKDSEDNREMCDMYLWCGICIMGDACPYKHPKGPQ